MEDRLARLAWRKSSHSSPNGNACVEVAAWRKSSHSETSGNACMEVTSAARVVLVRDTTDGDGAALAFRAAAWRAFTAALR